MVHPHSRALNQFGYELGLKPRVKSKSGHNFNFYITALLYFQFNHEYVCMYGTLYQLLTRFLSLLRSDQVGSALELPIVLPPGVSKYGVTFLPDTMQLTSHWETQIFLTY